MKKITLASVAAVALLSLVGTSAANAAQTRALPEGETLYAIDCEQEIGQLVSVDVVTGVSTPIGEGTEHEGISCAADAAYDPTSGLVYWASWDGYPNSLYSMDVATGVSTYIGELDAATNDIGGLMIGEDGIIYVIYYVTANEGSTFLGTVDPATAEITFEAQLFDGGISFGYRNIWSTSYNPADGEFYVVDSATRKLYQVDVTTGAATSMGVDGDNSEWYGLTFDSNGTMWSTGSDNVASITIDEWATAGAVSFSDEVVTLNGSPWFSESNFIVYNTGAEPVAEEEAELAETGLDTASVLGFAVAMFGGAAAVTVARRRARR